MAKRVIITDNGVPQYPITTTENVYDESGIQLNEVLINKAEADHTHENYVKQNEIMPLSTLNQTLNNKSNINHNHDGRYLTSDELNADFVLKTLAIMDKEIVEETELEDGSTSTVTRVIKAADMTEAPYQYIEPNASFTLFLPEIHPSKLAEMRLFIRPNVPININLPANIMIDTDLGIDYLYDSANAYELVFRNVNGWLVNFKIYEGVN